MQDARQERKMRALQLLALQNRWTSRNGCARRRKAAIVPQHATAPQGEVSMSAAAAPAQAPIDMSQFDLPKGAVRREAPAVAPDVNGVGGELTVPIGGQQVQGPPAFDRATYLASLSTSDPLLGEHEKSRYATQDAAQAEAAAQATERTRGTGQGQTRQPGIASGDDGARSERRESAAAGTTPRSSAREPATPDAARRALAATGAAAWSAYQQQGDAFLDRIAMAGVESKSVYEKAMQQPTEAGLAYTATGTGPQAAHATRRSAS
jgi:hypothetical protein